VSYLVALRALVVSMMLQLSPHLPPDAPAIADAIALAVLTEERQVLDDANTDLAALVVTARRESLFSLHPKPWRPEWGSLWCGAFQLVCETMPRTLLAQARKALTIIRYGVEQCPQSPLARYLGGCLTGEARREGDRRIAMTRWLLATQ
jgi:hypothetical protein